MSFWGSHSFPAPLAFAINDQDFPGNRQLGFLEAKFHSLFERFFRNSSDLMIRNPRKNPSNRMDDAFEPTKTTSEKTRGKDVWVYLQTDKLHH